MRTTMANPRSSTRRLASRPRVPIWPALVLALAPLAVAAQPDGVAGGAAVQGSAISYQGELVDGAGLANGNYDLRFRLYDQLAGGSLVGSPDTLVFSNHPVAAGLFSLALDFGADAFAGEERHLEIAVRPGGSAVAFTVLGPRQAVGAAPYAVHALTAGRARPRGFYLTTTVVAGNAAITACAAGYHMASMWEIFNVGTLEYNRTVGYTATDSGSGPPASIAGWIRTGVPSFTNAVPGNANCSSWTSNNPAHNGTRINLQPQWAVASEFTSPWDSTIQACGTTSRVWCVED
jgi:hypothetical protein